MYFQPDHIKCQLGPQALAAIGLRGENQSNNNSGPTNVVRSNPHIAYQQQQQQQQNRVTYGMGNSMLSQRASMTNGCQSGKSSNGTNTFVGQQPMNRHSISSSNCLSQLNDKYKSNLLMRPGHQGLMNLSRSHYNPVSSVLLFIISSWSI